MSEGGGQNPRFDAPPSPTPNQDAFGPPPPQHPPPHANPAIAASIPPQPQPPQPFANPAFGLPPRQHPPQPYADPAFGLPPHPQHADPVPAPHHHATAFGVWPPPPRLPNGKRRLEDPDPLDYERIKRVVYLVAYYVPLSDFFDIYPPTEPYSFKLGSSFGSIPEDQRCKTTTAGQYVLDGCFASLFRSHAMNTSYGGDFDPDDIFVSLQAPYDVIINKMPDKAATKANTFMDLDKVVDSVVVPRYGEEDNRPAYVDDFIARVKRLGSEMGQMTDRKWHQRRWVIRNHPLLVRAAKRRSILEDFYKFYKTLDPQAAAKLFEEITGRLYMRWHLLIARDDNFLCTVYWKGREGRCPDDHFVRDYVANRYLDEENPHIFRFTSEHGYLAVFLRQFVVHGPEEAMIFLHGPEQELWYGVSLEELDLIIAHFFGEFLSTFLDELLDIAYRYEMVAEILIVYADRRQVAR